MLLGQLAMPAAQATADTAVRARAARDEDGVDRAAAAARGVIEGYAASTGRLTELDDLARHEIGWRMAVCMAELRRAEAGTTPLPGRQSARH